MDIDVKIHKPSTSKSDDLELSNSLHRTLISDSKSSSFSISDVSSEAVSINEVDNAKTIGVNRPSASAWRQQKLPAWQPILTAETVLPAFFFLGVAFIPIGIVLLVTTRSVQEIQIDYTYCTQYNDPKNTCAQFIQDNIHASCKCRINFTLEEDFEAPVYLYYGLTNFYQNHRRYVKSRDDDQLYGREGTLSNDCNPYKEQNGKFYAPCGAIARSMFDDKFTLFLSIKNDYDKRGFPINLIEKGIAWPTDKAYKFKNPPTWDKSKYIKPDLWDKPVWELDTLDQANNGYQNEHLIVWMRTSALPFFRKLWGRINHDQDEAFRQHLPKGKYLLEIDYKFRSVFGKYRGEKKVIISNMSWLGGKNNFLGIAYLVFSGILLILWAVFFFIMRKYAKSAKDLLNIDHKTSFI